MSDVTDMILEGTLCEGCGVKLDNDFGDGFPQYCDGCEEEE